MLFSLFFLWLGFSHAHEFYTEEEVAAAGSAVMESETLTLRLLGQSGKIVVTSKDPTRLGESVKMSFDRIVELDVNGTEVQSVNTFANQDFIWELDDDWNAQPENNGTTRISFSTDVGSRKTGKNSEGKGHGTKFEVDVYFVENSGLVTLEKTVEIETESGVFESTTVTNDVEVTSSQVEFAITIQQWPWMTNGSDSNHRLSVGMNVQTSPGINTLSSDNETDALFEAARPPAADQAVLSEKVALLLDGSGTEIPVKVVIVPDPNSTSSASYRWTFGQFDANGIFYDPIIDTTPRPQATAAKKGSSSTLFMVLSIFTAAVFGLSVLAVGSLYYSRASSQAITGEKAVLLVDGPAGENAAQNEYGASVAMEISA